MLRAELDELKKDEPVAISVVTPDDKPEQEELRQSNYRVIETAQKQDQIHAKRFAELEKKCEQNVHDNRNIAITAIRTALPSGVKLASLPQSCTDQQYKQWITDAAETLKKSAETKATVSNAGKHEPLPKVAVAATDSAAKIKELEEKVKRYRSALATVERRIGVDLVSQIIERNYVLKPFQSSSIDTIEHEAAQKEKNYEREIAQLKKEIFHSRVLSDKAHRLKEKNITLDKRVNDLMRQLKRERGNGEQLNGQAAELRELLGTNIGDAESATAPFIRRHRSGRRHRKDSSGYNNEAGGESRRRKKCLSESAAHVTFLMAGEDRDPSSGRKSVEDEWEVVE
ncbi:unnamed protein product [Toxocara canis]|uniref:Nucleoporin GLE1 n=1 Tax=Toxocara canis TaxID=6265 RepID=A0A183TXX5_TOXCA|nr:unnamed protein product [Toxocara canis]